MAKLTLVFIALFALQLATSQTIKDSSLTGNRFSFDIAFGRNHWSFMPRPVIKQGSKEWAPTTKISISTSTRINPIRGKDVKKHSNPKVVTITTDELNELLLALASPAEKSKKHRTFGSAAELLQWVQSKRPSVGAVTGQTDQRNSRTKRHAKSHQVPSLLEDAGKSAKHGNGQSFGHQQGHPQGHQQLSNQQNYASFNGHQGQQLHGAQAKTASSGQPAGSPSFNSLQFPSSPQSSSLSGSSLQQPTSGVSPQSQQSFSSLQLQQQPSLGSIQPTSGVSPQSQQSFSSLQLQQQPTNGLHSVAGHSQQQQKSASGFQTIGGASQPQGFNSLQFPSTPSSGMQPTMGASHSQMQMFQPYGGSQQSLYSSPYQSLTSAQQAQLAYAQPMFSQGFPQQTQVYGGYGNSAQSYGSSFSQNQLFSSPQQRLGGGSPYGAAHSGPMSAPMNGPMNGPMYGQGPMNGPMSAHGAQPRPSGGVMAVQGHSASGFGGHQNFKMI